MPAPMRCLCCRLATAPRMMTRSRLAGALQMLRTQHDSPGPRGRTRRTVDIRGTSSGIQGFGGGGGCPVTALISACDCLSSMLLVIQ